MRFLLMGGRPYGGGTRVFDGRSVDETHRENQGEDSPQAALTCVVIGSSHDLI
jgi:hypothetical protein